MKSNRFWALLLGGLLLACLAAALALSRLEPGGSVAGIYLDGRLIETINLAAVQETYTLQVDGPAGRSVIEVAPGAIRVQAAGCPDQACVRQGWLKDGVIPLVCLPNRLVIRLEAGQGAGYDAVSY